MVIPSKEFKRYSPLGETDIPASGASTVHHPSVCKPTNPVSLPKVHNAVSVLCSPFSCPASKLPPPLHYSTMQKYVDLFL